MFQIRHGKERVVPHLILFNSLKFIGKRARKQIKVYFCNVKDEVPFKIKILTNKKTVLIKGDT